MWQLEITTPAPLSKPVLIWNGEHIAVGRKHHYKDNDTSWFIAESFGFNEDGEILNVSHWMELPQPPR